MKKSLYFAIFAVFTFFTPIFASEVCAKDSIVTVVLDPSINPLSSSFNSETGAWKSIFSYGTITGISACVETPSNLSDAVDTAIPGANCWCKMTHPMLSSWII